MPQTISFLESLEEDGGLFPFKGGFLLGRGPYLLPTYLPTRPRYCLYLSFLISEREIDTCQRFIAKIK